MTLLEKAKQAGASYGVEAGPKSLAEQAELAVAWIKFEVSTTQVCAALDKKGNGGNYIAQMLRDAHRAGLVEVSLCQK